MRTDFEFMMIPSPGQSIESEQCHHAANSTLIGFLRKVGY
jgi:hypothetical protein